MSDDVFFTFTPQHDIQPDEFAEIIGKLIGLVHVPGDIWDNNIPDHHKRHFTVSWDERKEKTKAPPWWKRWSVA